MKKHILWVISSILLAQNVSATTIPPSPIVCPAETAIKTVSVSTNTLEVDGMWVAGRRSQAYGTGANWSFLLGNIQATDRHDAYVKAKASLNHIFFEVGPFFDSFTNRWLCIYGTQAGYPAITANPPLVTLFDERLAHYLK